MLSNYEINVFNVRGGYHNVVYSDHERHYKYGNNDYNVDKGNSY